MEYEVVNNRFMKLRVIVLEQVKNVVAPTPPVNICRSKRWARAKIFANFRDTEIHLIVNPSSPSQYRTREASVGKLSRLRANERVG